jgi:hypothetical protein
MYIYIYIYTFPKYIHFAFSFLFLDTHTFHIHTNASHLSRANENTNENIITTDDIELESVRDLIKESARAIRDTRGALAGRLPHRPHFPICRELSPNSGITSISS